MPVCSNDMRILLVKVDFPAANLLKQTLFTLNVATAFVENKLFLGAVFSQKVIVLVFISKAFLR